MTAPIRSMPELIQALRDRARELQLTHETIDNVAGLQSGYTGKLLAPKPIKNLGPMSFESILGALGVAVVVVEDPEQVARVSKQWVKRERPLRVPLALPSPSMSASIPLEIEVTPALQRLLRNPEWMREIGVRGGHGRAAKLSAFRRRMIAKRAAKSRWAKKNERERSPSGQA
ncbi:MAG: hypothetical protein JWQ01_4925 [Massilia sp.]|nr:hypothetical protein [Massilia sp.]